MGKNKSGEDKEIERFRYENLVKARDALNTNFYLWMTFFTVAIGSLFVSYYTMAGGPNNRGAEITVVSFAGYFVSLFWHWSCKGYYWWVRSWINLIIHHEKCNLPDDKRVYSCFYDIKDKGCYFNPVKPANISTGKILGIFSFATAAVWGVLVLLNLERQSCTIRSLINCIAELFNGDNNLVKTVFYLAVSAFVSIFFGCIAKLFRHDMRNHIDIPVDIKAAQ